jgi:SAM-dependent methyltransferase
MPSAAYTDPRLAACYDALNPADESDGFYGALAGTTPKRILDCGCGTGRLAVTLAQAGHEVTGLDPAPGMLAVAQARPGAALVRWIEGDAEALPAEDRFDLVIMTGHVFQVFRSDEDIGLLLRILRQHLAPGGRLAFETRNPAVREWEDWTPEGTAEQVQVPGSGAVEVCYAVTRVEGGFVTYETRFRFGSGDEAVATDTLRFTEAAELDAFLRVAGFAEISWRGDWDGAPLGPASPEIIVIATA